LCRGAARLFSEHPSHASAIEKLIKAGVSGEDFVRVFKLLGNYEKLLKTDITGKFTQLRDATGKFRGAGTFWKRTGDDIVEHFPKPENT